MAGYTGAQKKVMRDGEYLGRDREFDAPVVKIDGKRYVVWRNGDTSEYRGPVK